MLTFLCLFILREKHCFVKCMKTVLEKMSSLLLLLLEDFVEEDVERRKVLKNLRDHSDPFEMTNRHFENAFRLPKHACHFSICELLPFDKQPTSLPFAFRFLSCLYFYANGSYQKCEGNNFVVPMSQSSDSRALNYISALITRHKSSAIAFITTNAKQLAIKARFYSKFGIKGTIGAIDCTHISILSPPKNNPTKPCSLFMNRKGYYSMNVEAVCDDNLKILAINANFPGSVHDSGICSTSKVRSFMTNQRGSWLLGDQGYPLEPWLMTPLAVASSSAEQKYNKIHCKARNIIERCFGVLKSLFRCLLKDRTLHYSPETCVMITNACAILHNILLERFPNMHVDVVDENEDENASGEVRNQVDDLHREGVNVRQQIINSLT